MSTSGRPPGPGPTQTDDDFRSPEQLAEQTQKNKKEEADRWQRVNGPYVRAAIAEAARRTT